MAGFNFYKLDNPGMADHDEIQGAYPGGGVAWWLPDQMLSHT